VSPASGLGPLFGKVFRIGHLGDLNEPMVLGTLGVIELCLRDLGVPHGHGAVEAALAALESPESPRR
jgi:alanine-glyoxylate transaminase/serine-glyoxylate transaminase/serine-pyruvate transaminase